ncbi:UDP-2,3-diacylglucosamine hydrolase, partial [Vibrio parahaemolyticus V-223/04]
NCASTLVTMDL